MQISHKLKHLHASHAHGQWSAEECSLFEELFKKHKGDIDCMAAEFPLRSRAQISQRLYKTNAIKLFEELETKTCNDEQDHLTAGDC